MTDAKQASELTHSDRLDAEAIKQILLRRICHLQYKAGDQLKEAELAREFGVSRTPVRDAINRISHYGLIASRNGVGTIVVGLSAEEIKAALANDGLREAAEAFMTKRAEGAASLAESARQQLQALGMSEADAARCYLLKGGEIAAAEDPKAATDAIGKLWLSAMTSGATQGDAAGGSTKEAALGPVAESRVGEGRKRLRDMRGW